MITSLKLNIIVISFLLLSSFLGCSSNSDVEMKNGEFCIVLSCNKNGIPFIKKGYWQNTGNIAFFDPENNNTYDDWLPSNLIHLALLKNQSKSNIWKVESRENLKIAKTSRELGALQITWTIELSHEGNLFRAFIQLLNSGKEELTIDWYPVWMTGWIKQTSEKDSVKYWEALSYQPNSRKIQPDNPIKLHSRVYSSDNHDKSGSVPFWKVMNQSRSLYFSLSWSGGWEADIYEKEEKVNVEVKLPPEETQLTLQPGESIEGPKLYIFSYDNTNLMQSRSHWLDQRKRWAENQFSMPNNNYPLIYNHWYSVRFDLSSGFLRNQLKAIMPYNFDFFVVDAGWYNSVGDWTPNRQKFESGEFENALQMVKRKGIKVGIWTCPWLIEVENDKFPSEVDEPHYYRKFMNAYALDLAGSNFEMILIEHISSLKKQFDIDWWKYDQELFGETSRNGRMKNIIALEKSLAGVRQSFPYLSIENCMSGGRMINEFTDQISQIHWIRDGGSTGLKHARSNIQEALGALQFLHPSKVQRWTNRPDEIDIRDKELLKMYCRSAMIGVWGISADMNKIHISQKEVILSEIKNYRRINELKSGLLYDIIYPVKGNDIAGIIYYNQDKENAAVLLFRWDNTGVISRNINIKLSQNVTYKIINIDTKDKITATGSDLNSSGLKSTLDEGQFSLLYFIEKMK